MSVQECFDCAHKNKDARYEPCLSCFKFDGLKNWQPVIPGNPENEPERREMIEACVNNMDNWKPEDVLELAKEMMRQDLMKKHKVEIEAIYRNSNAACSGGMT